MTDFIGGLSDAARDALRRRESEQTDDAGFEELAQLRVDVLPIARRGDTALGESAWFVTVYGLGWRYVLLERDKAAAQRAA